MREELVEKLKGKYYLNIDKATNNAMDKILNVMVWFFGKEMK